MCKLMNFLVIVFLYGSTFASPVKKRGIYDVTVGGFNSFDEYGGFGGGGAVIAHKIFTPTSVSPAEIAAAIQAAKEASARVMSAQQRVQEAKEEVLHQQHVASQKQAAAALALQKAEAAAAVQQQEAKSAATALVQAQQRLAQSKAEVAEQQKIASAKEAHAAAIIHKSAHAAAAEIQRSDEAARKISVLQHSGTSVLRQVAAAKQGSLTATSAAVSATVDSQANQAGAAQPWFGQKFVQYHPWG